MALLDDFISNCEQLIAVANNYQAGGTYDPGASHIVNTARPWTQTLAVALAQVNIPRPPPLPVEPVGGEAAAPTAQVRRRA